MRVRYNPAFAVLMLVAGAFIGGTGLLLGKLLLMGLGAMHVLVGLGYATQPWFVVHHGSIELKNLFGMTVKTHPIGLKDLTYRDGKLMPKDGGKPCLGGFLARKDDLEAIAARLG
ncbi:MAG: hypothetical protein CMH59_10380 [Myxococcales bacterium]|nr:hypothetical protein [Myxococcales bacterium]